MKGSFGRAVLLTLILSAIMLSQTAQVLAENPQTWMDPEKPSDKDVIRFYCRAPGAYDVSFNICADNGTVCYPRLNHGKTDSDTWWVEVGPLKAGTRAHYEVTITYQNETTGNESTVKLEPVHFEVAGSLTPPADNGTPFPGLSAMLAAIVISALVWRKVRRD